MLAKQISRKKSRRRREKIEISFVRGKFVKRREIPRKNFFPTTTAIDLAKKKGEKTFFPFRTCHSNSNVYFFPPTLRFPFRTSAKCIFLRSGKKKRKRLFFWQAPAANGDRLLKLDFFPLPSSPDHHRHDSLDFINLFNTISFFCTKVSFKGQTAQHAFYTLVVS